MKSILILLSLCVLASTARAGTNGFVVPSFRAFAEQPGRLLGTLLSARWRPGESSRQGWRHDTNAFLTGSGNIYNLGGTSEFTVSNAAPFPLGTVVLQTRTLGTELDYASVMLHYADGYGPQILAPLARYELNRGSQPGLGAAVSSLWQWDLRGLGVSNCSLAFRAAGPSTSFDAMTFDTSEQFIPVLPQPFAITSTRPDIERWMYANNGAPCDRPAGSVFGTFGDDAGVDTRHAQHLVGWDTSPLVPTNRGPARYLVRRARVTLTINRGNLFAYDPTQDDFRIYFETNHPAYIADGDAGRFSRRPPLFADESQRRIDLEPVASST